MVLKVLSVTTIRAFLRKFFTMIFYGQTLGLAWILVTIIRPYDDEGDRNGDNSNESDA